MWIYLLSPGGGLVNELLALIDVGPVRFLTNTAWARTTMIGLPIWKDMGYSAIIYLAAITTVSPTLYEAARIDGASRFQQAYQITLPLLKPTMKVVFMLNILGLLRIFDQIFVMRNPVVQSGVDVIMTYVYDMGILRYELGFASAISVMVLAATLVMTAIRWTSQRPLCHHGRNGFFGRQSGDGRTDLAWVNRHDIFGDRGHRELHLAPNGTAPGSRRVATLSATRRPPSGTLARKRRQHGFVGLLLVERSALRQKTQIEGQGVPFVIVEFVKDRGDNKGLDRLRRQPFAR